MTEFDISKKINDLVFSSMDRVVAAEPHSQAGKAELFVRENSAVKSILIDYKPFLIAANQDILKGSNIPFQSKELKGEAYYKHLIELNSLEDYDACLAFLKKEIKIPPSSVNSQYRVFTDIQQQIFLSAKVRLFRGMKYSEIRRMQFDIETLTTEGYDFPNPQRPDDKIIIISMRDSTGWEKCLSVDDNTSEKNLLEAFVDAVIERDPDVLEGHNIFRFDLPFIETRAKLHKVKLKLGRDGSAMKTRNSRFTAAERTISYKRYEAYGRHISDTYFLAQLYDVSHRNLESYNLKSIAMHFNVASGGRTYVEGELIGQTFFNDKEKLLKYAMDDAREVDAISQILSPSYFYQAQLQPFSFQNIITRGNATRIDAMLVSEYILNETSFGYPSESKTFEGALTEALDSGIFDNVWHCDIRSLYPSIITSEKINPASDTLKVFLSKLSTLRDIRIEAKKLEQTSISRSEKDFYNSMQTAFKILINSFYGYLAFNQGTFNDFSAAEHVTRRGREILTIMLNFLKNNGAKVIEMDTDGIYFQPSEAHIRLSTVGFEKEIQKALPEGIEVELDAVYKKMFCYKSKNYALLSDKEEISITGAALKSRGVEPFIRLYLHDIIRALLIEGEDDIADITEAYKERIEKGEIPLVKMAKTETLSESPDNYRTRLEQGKTRRSAAYELALKSGRNYKQGDQIAYYVTGDKKKVSVVDNCCLLKDAPAKRDENRAYYMQKIDELYEKFNAFSSLPPDQPEFNFTQR